MHSSDEWAVTGLVTADFCKGDNELSWKFAQNSGYLGNFALLCEQSSQLYMDALFKDLFLILP